MWISINLTKMYIHSLGKTKGIYIKDVTCKHKGLFFKSQASERGQRKNLQGRSHLRYLELLPEKLLKNLQRKMHTHFCIMNALSETGGKQTRAL